MGKDDGRQLAAGSGQPVSHLPSASLGHYAALSFIVRGRRSEERGQRRENRIVDSAFRNSQFEIWLSLYNLKSMLYA